MDTFHILVEHTAGEFVAATEDMSFPAAVARVQSWADRHGLDIVNLARATEEEIKAHRPAVEI